MATFALGDMAGRWLGSQLADAVGAKPIGKMVMGAMGGNEAPKMAKPTDQTVTGGDFSIGMPWFDTPKVKVDKSVEMANSEVLSVLKELLSAVNQPTQIKFDNGVIREVGNSLSMNKNYTAGMDNTGGRTI